MNQQKRYEGAIALIKSQTNYTEEEIDDIEGMNDWYMDIKERQKKSMKPIKLKKEEDE